MNNSVFGKFIENVSGCGAESKSSGDGLRAAEDRRKVVAVFGRRASGLRRSSRQYVGCIYPMRGSVPLKLGMRSRVAQCDFEALHLYIRMPLLSA